MPSRAWTWSLPSGGLDVNAMCCMRCQRVDIDRARNNTVKLGHGRLQSAHRTVPKHARLYHRRNLPNNRANDFFTATMTARSDEPAGIGAAGDTETSPPDGPAWREPTGPSPRGATADAARAPARRSSNTRRMARTLP